MKHLAKLLLLCLPLHLCAQKNNMGIVSSSNTKTELLFTENKGQVADIFDLPQPQILFTAGNEGVKLFITASGIHYQFLRPFEKKNNRIKSISFQSEIDSVQLLRVDMKLLGAQVPDGVIKESPDGCYSNFYLAHCPQGALNVKSYERIIFKNVYPGIDWILYDNKGKLEYDFELQANADISQIKIQYIGADHLELTPDGSLKITTALGTIKEHSPISMQGIVKVNSAFVIKDNIVGFDASYNTTQPLRIDPNIVWATYYGGNYLEEGHSTSVDKSGNVFLVGDTYSPTGIASTTGLQTILKGFKDAFIVKFNDAGQRQWATYYGGNGYETGLSSATDKNNNIYVFGSTNSTSGISTAGAHQATFSGINDAYLLKLNSNGQRQWATYYGGSKDETGYSCAIDTIGNIYISGKTSSTNKMVTASGAQTTFGGNVDAFLAKFNTNGVRQWGTYYGGTGVDYGYGCSVESNGTVYMTGTTASSNAIATVGSFQIARKGASDGFLVKFNTSGVRQWATYIGGDSTEDGLGTCVDINGNVFVSGITESASNIASGGFANTYSDGGDAYLIKFNTSGSRQWCTYYGGNGFDAAYNTKCDSLGSVTMAGVSFSTNGIAGGGFQNSLQGDADCFAAKFSSTGLRIWGTYYGGNMVEYGNGIALGSLGNIFIAGNTSSATNVASNGYDNTLSGTSDAFLLKINDRATSDISIYNQFNSNYAAVLLDSTNTANTSPSPVRVSADGSTATFVNYYNKDANILINNIIFRIKEDPTGINKEIYGYFNAAINVSTAPQIRRCYYNHPTYLNNGNLFRNITIQILDSTTNTILEEYPVQAYKAPLLLVHGLYGNAESFKNFEKDFLFASGANIYPGTTQTSPFVLRTEYNYADGLVKNNSIIKLSIDRLLKQMVDAKYSTGKVDIIAHSMGGLLSRAYIQDPYNIQAYRNDVHKLITLNAMHAGSQFADCISNPNSDCALWAIVQNYIRTNSTTIPSGMNELGTQSEVIDSLLNSYTVSKTNLVPTASLTTTISTLTKGPSEPCAGAGIATQNLNIFNGETNDKMVALSSQQGNIIPAKGNYISCHENAVNTSALFTQLGTLIHQNPIATNFDIDGYKPTALSYTPIVVPTKVGNQTISFSSPMRGSIVTPGQVINIIASGSNLTKRMELYIGNEYVPTTAFDTSGKNINYTFNIPSGTIGVLRMIAVGRDSVNAFKYDTLSIKVIPTAVLDSIRSYPQKIIVPEYMRSSFEVYGYYHDGTIRTLSSLSDVSYTINNTTIATPTTGAEIQGNVADTTSILISYLGRTHRTPIEVVNGKDYQRAAFYVNDTLLCPGSSGRFTNTSTGNAIAYNWSFEGGSPATSTATNPVVSYGINGKYDVELITTFAGGIKDTLKFKDYIVVGGSVPNNPPGITVTGGKTKPCPADTTTYSLNTVFNATSYFWLAPIGGSVISGQGTPVAKVVYNTGFIQDDSIRASSSNKCGTSGYKAVAVKRNEPSPPSAITGQKDGMCSALNVPYSVDFVDSISFNWRYVFNSGTVVLGQGKNQMQANYNSTFTVDTLKVSASNTCGISTEKSLPIKALPIAPPTITGLVTVCANQSNVPYSIDPLPGAISYTWIAPGNNARISDGITTSTTNTFTTTSRNVTVNYSTISGNLSVRGNNTCGTGLAKFQSITVNSCVASLSQSASILKASLYPNPSVGNTFVKISNTKDPVTVWVTDMSGRVIWESMSTTNHTIEIPTQKLAAGTYMVVIKNSTNTINEKLLKVN